MLRRLVDARGVAAQLTLGRYTFLGGAVQAGPAMVWTRTNK